MRLVSILWEERGKETGRRTIKKMGCRGGCQTRDSGDVLGGGEDD